MKHTKVRKPTKMVVTWEEGLTNPFAFQKKQCEVFSIHALNVKLKELRSKKGLARNITVELMK